MPSDETPSNRGTWVSALLSALAGALLIGRAVTNEKAAGPRPPAPGREAEATASTLANLQAQSAAPAQRVAPARPALPSAAPHHDADVGGEHHPIIPQTPLRPGWNRPLPAGLPHPTYWPAVLGLGLLFLAWGLVTSLVVSVVGLVLFGLGLAGWIGDLRNDTE